MIGSDAPVFRDARFWKQGKGGTYKDLPLADVPRVGCVTDSHCHLQYCTAPEIEAARAEVWGVQRLCNVVDLAEDGWDTVTRLEKWLAEGHVLAKEFASEVGVDPETLQCPDLSIIVGCHPENASKWTPALAAELREHCHDPRVVAIGEAGLEYHYLESPKEVQQAMFREHIRLAHETGLPLCLHVREAHDEAFRILEEESWPEAGCVLHCYTADVATLEPWLTRGCYVGFDGPLTFAKSDELRAAAKTVPLDRLLVETDAPFMAPAPLRGMPCGPAHVIFTAVRLAEVFDVSPDGFVEFCGRLHENAARLYKSRGTTESEE